MGQPLILGSVAALRAWRAECRRKGETVGMVPTMGALHMGHLSLVNRVRQLADRAVVSIFVNPTQFGANEDFSKYPVPSRMMFAYFLRSVRMQCSHRRCRICIPTALPPRSPWPPAKVGLEDAFRPTHFSGVATVVSKLLLQCLPDSAIFGEKDYQQLAVIRHMVRDLDIPVEIIAGATVREADGIAMSSRNVYLSPNDRLTAVEIYRAMQAAAESLRGGAAILAAETSGRMALSLAGFAVDYFAVRHAQTLEPLAEPAQPRDMRILVAAKIGNTR